MGQPARVSVGPALRALTPYLFLLPAALVLGLFLLWPLADAAYLSFTRYNALSPPVWIGLANYTRLAADPLFWQTLLNTFL
ncbi:MAG TPA: sugar ABC transporter permease, partial [Oscillatoriaceae cyanobacterium]